jgi:hypothetical protein
MQFLIISKKKKNEEEEEGGNHTPFDSLRRLQSFFFDNNLPCINKNSKKRTNKSVYILVK